MNSRPRRFPSRAAKRRSILAQGASPGFNGALTPSRVCGTPLCRSSERGRGRGKVPQPAALTLWDKLWRSFGSELCCELRLEDTSLLSQ